MHCCKTTRLRGCTTSFSTGNSPSNRLPVGAHSLYTQQRTTSDTGLVEQV